MNTVFNTRSGTISIGENVLFAHGCMVLTGRHKKPNANKPEEIWEVPETGYDIVIDDNVFIGSGAILCGGIHIGTNSVIGAGAVVTKDVAPNSFVKGVPSHLN